VGILPQEFVLKQFVEECFYKPEYDKFFSWVFTHTDVFRTIEPYREALIAIMVLADAGYEIHYCTDRFQYKDVYEDTYRWLYRWGFPCDYVNFVRTEDKAEFVKRNEYFAIIEDRTQTVYDCAKLEVPSYLIARSWNEDYQEIPNAPLARVSWADITKPLVDHIKG